MAGTVDEPALIPRDAQQNLDRFFLTPRRFYFEHEFSSLATTLGQNGMYEWAQVPKLYFVLRCLGRQDLISTFVSRGLTDTSIPIEDGALSSVAGCPSSEFHARFHKYQKRAQKHDTAVYEESLATFFASSIDASKKSIGDAEFGEVARLLEFCGKSDAAKTPKLYYLLRSINELESLQTFQAKGYSDLWFPFPKSSLNSGLFSSKASQQLFLNLQSLVCSTRWSEHVHMNFDEDDLEFIDHRRELGEGGTGEVDLVYCASTGKEYARKRVLRTSQGLRYFSNEIAMLKSVCHQHCVSLVGSYTDPYNLAILCRPVADMNLATLLDSGMIPNDRKDLLQSSFGCLSVALRYLHGKDIRHKDIKPQNILIHGNNLLFTDFGLSSDEIQSFTTTASKTARYSAPEVEDGARRDFASDAWALGCVFFEIIAALCGFTIGDVKEYFRNHGEKRLNFAANAGAIQSFLTETWLSEKLQHYKHIPSAITDLTLEMLKFNPVDRPATDSLVSRLADGLQESQNPYGRCCRYEIMKAQQPTRTESNSVRQRKDWDGTGTPLVSNKPDTELTHERAPINISAEPQQNLPRAQSTYSNHGRRPYAAYYSSSSDTSEEEVMEVENDPPRALAARRPSPPPRLPSPKSRSNRSDEQQKSSLRKNELSQEDAHDSKSATAHLVSSKSTEQTEITSIPLRSRGYDTNSTGPTSKSPKPPVEPPHSTDRNMSRANDEAFQPSRRVDYEIRDGDKRKTVGGYTRSLPWEPRPYYGSETKKKKNKKDPSNTVDISAHLLQISNSHPQDKLPENKPANYSNPEDTFSQFFRTPVGDETTDGDYSRLYKRDFSNEPSDNKPPTARHYKPLPLYLRSTEHLSNFPPPPRRDPPPRRSGIQPKEYISGEDNGNDEGALQDPNPLKWTRVSRDLVNPKALAEAGEMFEIKGNYIKIFRTVPRTEIQELAERTKELRQLRY